MDDLLLLIRAPQVAAMFFLGSVIGFFFAAVYYKRPSLIVKVLSAAFALLPICIIGFGLFMQSLQAGLYVAMFMFPGPSFGFMLIGLPIGAVIGFASAKILTRERQAPSGG